MATHEPYLAGLLLANDACKVAGTEASVERSHLGTCLSEDGVVAGNGEIAHEVQHMTAANGEAVNHSDDRLGQRANLLLHVKNVETWHTIVADIAATAFDVHVATRAEGLVASTCKDDHTYALRLATPGKRLRHLPCGAGCEGVTITRTVYCNLGYAVIFFEENLLKIEILNLYPFTV